MKTKTPLFIAAIILVAMLLSMVSCQSNIEEKPICTESSVIQDIYLKGSILYYKDKPVVLQDSVKELLEQGINNLPRVATMTIEYKDYYYMVLN